MDDKLVQRRQREFDKIMAEYMRVRDNPDLPSRGKYLQRIGRARINLAKARGETELLRQLGVTGVEDAIMKPAEPRKYYWDTSEWPYDHAEKHRQAAIKGHRKK